MKSKIRLSRIWIPIVIFSISPCITKSQDPTKIHEPLQQGELNRVLNSTFNKLVTSNPNPGEIANYATLDPINAIFSVKSTIPIQPGRKKKLKGLSMEEKLGNDPGNISYLSLTASGKLIDKNYGAIFSNSSLNAGVSLGMQYNFKIKTPKFSYFREDWDEYDIKRSLLLNAHSKNRIAIEKNINEVAFERNKYLIGLQKISNDSKMQKNSEQQNLIQKTIDTLGTDIKNRPGLGDTLQKAISEGISLQKNADAILASLDSLNLVSPDLSGRKKIQLLSARTKLKKDYDTLLSKLELQKVSLGWFTVSAAYLRKSFTTFDYALPFDSQIDKDKLNAYNFGVAFNHLCQNRLNHRTFFLNLGLSFLKNNNLNFLTTTIVEQTKDIVNPAGDITRKITNKYTAYTDPVESFNALNFTAHAYYIFGKTPSGFHISPSVNVQNNDLIISNFTFGYLIAFQNTVKDQPIINTEIYVRFNDFFNDNKADSKAYNRNEIGISFTVPFNIF